MAAIGAGLPVSRPGGNLVVDIGGGTTECRSHINVRYRRFTLIAHSGQSHARGDQNYVKRKYNLLLGERTAEQTKIEIGSAAALEKPVTMEVKGRSLSEGIPKAITVDDSEIREALNECVSKSHGQAVISNHR